MNYVDTAFESPAILSLCPGIRGLERGLERAIGPARTIAYVEIEAFAVENLVAGMEAGILAPAPVWTNLKTFDASPFRGKVHGITGGYPCQPFSNAGNRGGAADPRHLWPHIERVVDAVRPLWCFFENVRGHISLGFREVRESLGRMGYAVESGIFSAAEVGASHERERLFILAVANGYLLGAKRKHREFQDPANHPEGKTHQREWRGDESVGGRTAMADAECSQWRPIDSEGCEDSPRGISLHEERAEGASGISECGKSLADRVGQRLEGRPGKSTWEEQSPVVGAGPALAYADCSGQPKQRDDSKPAYPGDDRTGDAGADRWPAGPGQPQHDWESARTIEPRMGCRINGYNFREDFLRALGNSVVEQTAELAFRTLYEKHFGYALP